MDSKQKLFWESTTNKFYYMGIAFVALFASKLILDVIQLSIVDESEDYDDSDSESSNSEESNSWTPNTPKKSEKTHLNPKGILKKSGNVASPESFQTSQKSINVTQKEKIEKKQETEENDEMGYRKLMQRKKKILQKEGIEIVKICFTGGPCAGKIDKFKNFKGRQPLSLLLEIL